MNTEKNIIKVSIIIPVYNVQKYLRECLDSVLNQTLKEIEIICVNDGSTDGSYEILKEYAEKDERVKLISKTNSGYGHTMNVGIEAATGEYIGIVESDDFVKQDMYEKLYGLAKDNDADIVKADFYRFAEINGKLELDYNDLSHGKTGYYNRIINPAEEIEIFKFLMNTWSGIYKKAFIDRFNIRHNETPGASFQDNGFFFQTFCQASRVYFVNKPFYMNRRDNPNSSVESKEKVFCTRDEYQFIREFLERKPELKNRFIYVYWIKKYHNYLFTYGRIGDKFKKIFLDQFSKEFIDAKNNGELDKSLFTTKEWERLKRIMYRPERFYVNYRRTPSTDSEKPFKIYERLIQYIKEFGLCSTAIIIIKKLVGMEKR